MTALGLVIVKTAGGDDDDDDDDDDEDVDTTAALSFFFFFFKKAKSKKPLCDQSTKSALGTRVRRAKERRGEEAAALSTYAQPARSNRPLRSLCLDVVRQRRA